jgi:hypothetical protein
MAAGHKWHSMDKQEAYWVASWALVSIEAFIVCEMLAVVDDDEHVASDNDHFPIM